MQRDAEDVVDDVRDDGDTDEHEHADGRLQEHGEGAEALDAARVDADDVLDGNGYGLGDVGRDVVAHRRHGRDEAGLFIALHRTDAVGDECALPAEGDDVPHFERLLLLVGENVDKDERTVAEAPLVLARHVVRRDREGRNAEHGGRFVGVDAPLDDER